jgi:antitoxin (DNA-binding transcriptional repressor) of toxin-antitoxin stability system
MTTNVSFTEFRQKLTDYIELLKNGAEIVIKDAKKGKEIVTLVAKKAEKFDWDEHISNLKSLAGSGLLSSRDDENARKKFRLSLKNRFDKAKIR